MDYQEKNRKIEQINNEICQQSNILNNKKSGLSSLKESKKSLNSDLKSIERVLSRLCNALEDCRDVDSEVDKTVSNLREYIICNNIDTLLQNIDMVNDNSESRIGSALSSANQIRNKIESELDSIKGKIDVLDSEIDSIMGKIRTLSNDKRFYEGRY